MAGVKGKSGRKSYWDEITRAVELEEMFFTDKDKEAIKAKLSSGKYSLRDVWISKGFSGNERILTEIFKKIFPDKMDLSSGGKPLQTVINIVKPSDDKPKPSGE